MKNLKTLMQSRALNHKDIQSILLTNGSYSDSLSFRQPGDPDLQSFQDNYLRKSSVQNQKNLKENSRPLNVDIASNTKQLQKPVNHKRHQSSANNLQKRQILSPSKVINSQQEQQSIQSGGNTCRTLVKDKYEVILDEINRNHQLTGKSSQSILSQQSSIISHKRRGSVNIVQSNRSKLQTQESVFQQDLIPEPQVLNQNNLISHNISQSQSHQTNHNTYHQRSLSQANFNNQQFQNFTGLQPQSRDVESLSDLINQKANQNLPFNDKVSMMFDILVNNRGSQDVKLNSESLKSIVYHNQNSSDTFDQFSQINGNSGRTQTFMQSERPQHSVSQSIDMNTQRSTNFEQLHQQVSSRLNNQISQKSLERIRSYREFVEPKDSQETFENNFECHQNQQDQLKRGFKLDLQKIKSPPILELQNKTKPKQVNIKLTNNNDSKLTNLADQHNNQLKDEITRVVNDFKKDLLKYQREEDQIYKNYLTNQSSQQELDPTTRQSQIMCDKSKQDYKNIDNCKVQTSQVTQRTQRQDYREKSSRKSPFVEKLLVQGQQFLNKKYEAVLGQNRKQLQANGNQIVDISNKKQNGIKQDNIGSISPFQKSQNQRKVNLKQNTEIKKYNQKNEKNYFSNQSDNKTPKNKQRSIISRDNSQLSIGNPSPICNLNKDCSVQNLRINHQSQYKSNEKLTPNSRRFESRYSSRIASVRSQSQSTTPKREIKSKEPNLFHKRSQSIQHLKHSHNNLNYIKPPLENEISSKLDEVRVTPITQNHEDINISSKGLRVRKQSIAIEKSSRALTKQAAYYMAEKSNEKNLQQQRKIQLEKLAQEKYSQILEKKQQKSEFLKQKTPQKVLMIKNIKQTQKSTGQKFMQTNNHQKLQILQLSQINLHDNSAIENVGNYSKTVLNQQSRNQSELNLQNAGTVNHQMDSQFSNYLNASINDLSDLQIQALPNEFQQHTQVNLQKPEINNRSHSPIIVVKSQKQNFGLNQERKHDINREINHIPQQNSIETYKQLQPTILDLTNQGIYQQPIQKQVRKGNQISITSLNRQSKAVATNQDLNVVLSEQEKSLIIDQNQPQNQLKRNIASKRKSVDSTRINYK
eukprot:403365738